MQANLAIGVVGSGPAGCYLAQALRRSLPHAEITIFDRLASPFGLVRYGVAPDHQGTKSIQAQFGRLFERDNVRFAGNVDVGSDLTLEDLHRTHHVVVLATGLTRDRALGVPGEHLPGVYGAGQVTRTLNSHPVEASTLPALGRSVTIVGGGNVSLDVVRLLVKTPAEFTGSDINDTALARYSTAPATHLDLICRSSAGAAPFDLTMLAELGKTPGVRFVSTDPYESGDLTAPAWAARSAVLKELLLANRGPSSRITVQLHFGWAPTRILGKDHVKAIEVRSTSGSFLRTVPADSVITAIGFDFDPSDRLLGTHGADAETGRLAEGLYRTGWAKRGSKGTIAQNRQCAKAVAEEIVEDLARSPQHAMPGYAGLPASIRERAVNYEGWLRIDQAERTGAPEGRTRKKEPDHGWMVATARDRSPA